MKRIEQAISSIEVAEMVGKSHDKLLRDIRRYIEQLSLTKIGEGIKIIKGKSKHNKKRFPIPGAFLQHVFGDLIPLIC